MSTDRFSPMETFFDFSWPETITGLERIALTATGNLQRFLSVYFGKPIRVEEIWEIPASGHWTAASPEHPVTKVREVNLLCEGAVVCLCLSTIKMTTPETAKLFLEDGVAVGQMYRTLGRVPTFTLTDVSVHENLSGVEHLARSYCLSTEGFECEIREIFPDRRIFTGECWDRVARNGEETKTDTKTCTPPQAANAVEVH
ncbi:hypothetical protein FRB96_002693 [Tulasnella sp. 330]|nr:hypothetical protein FRB96_002693 [Tulasnella sp. 330]KAG8884389.1 hypothetical protein FRB97_004398 [Tulasnella sp. 331]KAG8888058.1 hypothetical protein FRB98_008522 [Tulasnella sp. 332]